MSVNDCKLIEFPIVRERRGNLSFVESGENIPFEIKRVYYLYDVPAGSERGGHAHLQLQQLLIAVSGSFDVILNDGTNERCFHLNRPHIGLYISSMIWRSIGNFSS